MLQETELASEPRSGRATTRKDRLVDGSALTKLRQGALPQSQHRLVASVKNADGKIIGLIQDA